MYKRPIYTILRRRLDEPRRFIQVLMGPRQAGKTTLVHQIRAELDYPCHYASADEPALKDRTWIEQEWETARFLTRSGGINRALLVLDEVQKIPGWSEIVKRLWDEDTASHLPVYVVILGSSALLVGHGLSESLAGRFEIIPVPHWSYAEMKAAFHWDLEQYVFFGGYPGAAALIDDHDRWARYIVDSLIETTISRDVLLVNRIYKPALLRRLFEIGCRFSGQVLSYQKMLGQLQDAGNTTTLAHYLSMLESAGMLSGLPKYSGRQIRQRSSSPKLQVQNTALMTAQSGMTFGEAKKDPAFWGRLTESAIGASLINSLKGTSAELFYWSSGHYEVDFVVNLGTHLAAIEVKSGLRKTSLPGMSAFSAAFDVQQKLLIGAQGIAVEEFLLSDMKDWLHR